MNSPAASNVRYLTAEDLLNLNHAITHDPMVRDIHLLHSAVRRPRLLLFGEPQFPTLADKAAALMESLAYHHLFVDGNKRTAVQAVTHFLERNGQHFDYDAARDADFVLAVARGEHDTAAIAAWIEARMSASG
ncbi:MAG: type II toxin-antitoxin system death-on-curing family toxin [Anaerolineae bacterium]|nr:type II toxin-antitoxin system death-on-curing family toxin [Anaerolineae bacterium]